ncbi:MAG TPA: hypothetical protein VL094_09980 [Sphingomonadaceae bacterium]|nr:hypothetical protein [Sphingomonadaceae bacterium]
MKLRLSAALLSATLIAACVPAARPPVPTPAPTPSRAPAPAPTPTPPPPLPAPVHTNWMDAPRSPGNWFYKQAGAFSFAAYGASEKDFGFVMRCDRAARSIAIGRVSAQTQAQPMRIRTESTDRLFNAMPRQGSIETLLAVDVPASDPLLDAMAISKGRFAVETRGEPTLYIPSWPEVTRVIEDCR